MSLKVMLSITENMEGSQTAMRLCWMDSCIDAGPEYEKAFAEEVAKLQRWWRPHFFSRVHIHIQLSYGASYTKLISQL